MPRSMAPYIRLPVLGDCVKCGQPATDRHHPDCDPENPDARLMMLCRPCHTREHKKGRKKSADHRAKLSAALRGRTFSDESKAKMSASMKGRKAWNKGLTKADYPNSKEN